MTTKPPAAADRLLNALELYRNALRNAPSGATPDPLTFTGTLTPSDQARFLAEVGAARGDQTLDSDAGSAVTDQTLDSGSSSAMVDQTMDSEAPVSNANETLDGPSTPDAANVGTVTLDSDSGKTPQDLPNRVTRTKHPGAYESQGRGDFEVDETPSSHGGVDKLADYELLGELGHGGMGVVYKARQKQLNRVVALKMVLAGGRASKTQLARFVAEARAVARLDHPNIVQVYDIGEHDGLPFFAMEFVDGGALDSLVKKQSLEPKEAARMMETVCRAMHYAHTKGVIHRDLKPANILLMDAGKSSISRGEKSVEKSVEKTSKTGPHSALKTGVGGPIPKITDFGLAKQLDDENSGATKSGAVMGTPNYMAPEQAEGNTKDVTPLADVYSLGATLYELITGRPPFQGPSIVSVLSLVRSADPVNPSRLQPGIAKDLETICLKAMQKEPGKRYASAELMADDLARFLDGQPILARPISSAEKLVRWCKRKPREASLWLTAANIEVTKERDAASRQSSLNAEQVKYLLRTLSAELKTLGLTKQREKLVQQAMSHIGKLERLSADSKGIADRSKVSSLLQIAEFYRELGIAEKDVESFRRAEEKCVEAVSVARQIMESSPDSDLARGNYALTLARLADSRKEFSKIDGPDGADALAKQSFDLRKSIVDEPKSTDPATRDYLFPADRLRSLAESCSQLATLAELKNQKDDVRQLRREAKQLREKAYDLAKSDPTTSEEPLKLAPFQSSLAQSYITEAAELSAESGVEKDAKKAQSLRAESEKLLEQALQLSERAVDDNAESVPFKKDLSSVLFRVGVSRLIAGKFAEARDAFDRTYSIRVQIVKQGDEKTSKQNRWDLSLALYGVGVANIKLGERAKGTSAFRDCLTLREKLLAEDDQLQYVRGVMTAAARTGNHARAMKLIESEASREPARGLTSTMFLFDSACTASLAAHAVGNWAADDKLTADQKALRAKYLDTAWSNVKKLAAANPAKAREFATDPDCEFLQAQPNFKATLDSILSGKN